MPTLCPSRTFDRPLFVVRTVVVGAVLAAVLPANAVDALGFRHATSSRAVAPPNTGIELILPVLVDTPVHLRVRTEDASQRGGFEIAPQVVPTRPTVTILTPTDLAAVPAGTLRVRGTASVHGETVRVVVNGVRALVKLGMFTAAVRVTPDTMILTAVATTPQGATARHQIGLSVSGTAVNGLRFRPFPGCGVAALTKRFSLLPGTVSASVKADPGSESDGATPAASPGPPAYMTAAANNAGAATMVFVLARGVLDEHGPGKPRILVENARDVGIEPARSLIIMNTGPEQRGLLSSGTPDVQPLLLGGSRDGELGDKFRGMRRRSEYSFGMLFIFDTHGFWRLRWY